MERKKEVTVESSKLYPTGLAWLIQKSKEIFDRDGKYPDRAELEAVFDEEQPVISPPPQSVQVRCGVAISDIDPLCIYDEKI